MALPLTAPAPGSDTSLPPAAAAAAAAASTSWLVSPLAWFRSSTRNVVAPAPGAATSALPDATAPAPVVDLLALDRARTALEELDASALLVLKLERDCKEHTFSSRRRLALVDERNKIPALRSRVTDSIGAVTRSPSSHTAETFPRLQTLLTAYQVLWVGWCGRMPHTGGVVSRCFVTHGSVRHASFFSRADGAVSGA